MGKVKVKLSVDSGALSDLAEFLESELKRRARGNFADFRPIVSRVINESVEQEKDNFIPTQDEVGQLGIGDGGEPSDEKIFGAYKQLRTDHPTSVTSFTSKATGAGSKGDKIGEFSIDVSEEELLSSPLANHPVKSIYIDNIPWMDWLINGKVIQDWSFSEGDSPFSRTGLGLMIKGGLWSFESARKGAFLSLDRRIRKNLEKSIRDGVGKILK